MELKAGRVHQLMMGFLVLFLLLILRLAWLQIVQGPWFAAVATDYHSRTIYYRWGHGHEGRGLIVDRNGLPFTEGQLMPGAAVFAAVGKGDTDYQQWLNILSQHSGFSATEIELRSTRRQPIPLVSALPRDLKLPHWIKPVSGAWDIEGNFLRYAHGDLARHVLGFVSSPYPGERGNHKRIGRLGVEAAFDELLRCPRPGVSAFVNARDMLIPGLGYRSTFPEEELPVVTLTLDIEIQQATEELLDRYIAKKLLPKAGAVVVMDPRTGDILAMVSRPLPEKGENEQNRALRKAPGVQLMSAASLIKLLTAAAALDHDVITPNTLYDCSGSINQGGNIFGCWLRSGHGQQDLAAALAASCNVYFAEVAMAVGAERLLALAQALGLGETFALGLRPGEVEGGSLPSLKDLATPAGLTNHFSLGSNRLEVTPLQMAVMVAAIANGGNRIEPRLVISTKDGRGETLFPSAPPRRVLRPSTANDVSTMMRHTVIHGLAGAFNKERYSYAAQELAAKTGTSDLLMGVQIRWIAGFFPWRDPRYLVVYMGEAAPGERYLREQFLAELAQILGGS